jgi:adenylate cyclase
MASIGSVDEHTRDDVARKAGVEPAYVDRLVELEILVPAEGSFSTGDVRRARWVRALEDSGVPLDGMAAAVREGALSFSYLDAPAFDRFAGVSATTFRAFSERTGVPLALLMGIREAFGYAEPSRDDLMLEDELSVASAVEMQLAKGFRPAVVAQWLRVYADNLRRIAEMETEWWRSEVEQPLLRGGMTESEMLEAQAEVGSAMTPLMEQAIVSIYRGQQEHAWTKTAVEDVEAALEKAGLHQRPRRAPAVAFLDITGYTRLTEEHGDEAAADLAARLATLVRRSSQAHGGQPVKWLGDGVMFYFPDPAPSVVAALDMVTGVSQHDLPPAHVGIHTGPVVIQEGDYFGRTVNIASRIADYARPGEVLVTQEVAEVAKELPVSFTDVGPVELKGMSGSLHLLSAQRAR